MKDLSHNRYLHIVLYILAGCLWVSESRGQDPIFSQHFAAPLYLNPAFAGAGADKRFAVNYRNHPYPGFGTFSTMNFSYDTYVPGISGGLGVVVTSDHQGGLLMKNSLSAVYAYHVQLLDRLFVHFGAQAGYTRRDVMWNRLRFPDPSEAPPEQTWTHGADLAAGILLYSKQVYGGIAVHHLNRPNESLFGEHRLAMKYTAHLGLFLEPSSRRRANTLSHDYFFSPNLIFQNQGAFYRINYGLYAGFESFVAGVWYRQDLTQASALIFTVGLMINNYKIGYSYDYSLSGFSGPTQGAHEISLLISIDDPIRNLKRQIINCPSF